MPHVDIPPQIWITETRLTSALFVWNIPRYVVYYLLCAVGILGSCGVAIH